MAVSVVVDHGQQASVMGVHDDNRRLLRSGTLQRFKDILLKLGVNRRADEIPPAVCIQNYRFAKFSGIGEK